MIGLWIDYNLSVICVCAECLIGALLLAVAHWTGRLAERQAKHRPSYAGLAETLIDDTPKPSISAGYELGSEFVQYAKVVQMPTEFADKGIKLFWPFATDFAMHILKDVILPGVREQVPRSLGCEIEVDESTDIGQITPCFTQLLAVPITKNTNTYGQVKNLRILASFTYNGEAKVSLNFKMLKNSKLGSALGSVTQARIGIKGVKVNGLAVVELVNLSSVPPFFGGLRLYFANPPCIDFDIDGHFSHVLNLSYVKSMILSVVQDVLGTVMVMPNQFVIPVDRSLDVWRFAAGRPDGLLTIQVIAVSGATNVGAKVGVALGGEKYQTSEVRGVKGQSITQISGHDEFTFLVGDMYSQCLLLTFTKLENSSLLGFSHAGEVLEQCDVLVSDLLKGASGFFWEAWCNFSDASADGVNGRPMLKTISPTSNEKVCVKLRVKWQKTQQHSLCVSSSTTTSRQVDQERYLLLVGVDTLYDVPKEETTSRKYWVTVTKRAGTDDPEDAEASEPVCEKRTGKYSAHCTDKVCWQNPLVFYVTFPASATITLRVQSAIGSAIETIGTVKKVAAPDLEQGVFTRNYEEILSTGNSEMRLAFVTRLWAVGPQENKYSSASSAIW